MSEKKKKTKKEIETQVRQKVDCEEKAFRWVEHLAMVDNISEEELGAMLGDIMINHYHDITEERAISKVCGYPLCRNKLGKRSHNRYHISMKYNKVIDLSVRENFCSLYCFQASRFVADQVPTEPVWLRTYDSFDVKLLEKQGSGGKSGKEVVVNDLGEVPLNVVDLTDIETPKEKAKKKKGKRCDGLFSDEEEDSSDPEEFYAEDNPFNSDDETTCNTKKSKSAGVGKRQAKLIDPKEVGGATTTMEDNSREILDKTTKVLQEWFSPKSFQHLQTLKEKCIDSDDDDDDDNDDDDDGGAGKSIFPESDALGGKLSNFLLRQPEWLSEACYRKEESTPGAKPKENAKEKMLLPTVDSRSQQSIRRRIVHEKVAGSLKHLLPVCGLLESDLSRVQFFNLVDTFNFTSKNIVLNSKQWTSVTIFLLVTISRVFGSSFGCMKSRAKDINDFLLARSLPGLVQVEGTVRFVLEQISKVELKKEKHNDDLVSACVNSTIDFFDYMDEVD